MNNSQKLLFTYFLLLPTAPIIAMDATSPTNIRRASFDSKVTVYEFTPSQSYLKSLRDNNEEIKANMIRNAIDHLAEKGLTVEERLAQEQQIKFTNRAIVERMNEANALSAAASRNQLGTSAISIRRIEEMEPNCFYENTAIYIFRASLVVGGLYLASRYFQKKK